MSRFVLLLTSVALVFALSASAASAASLTISASDFNRKQGDRIPVKYSGTADAPSYLTVYATKGDTACAPTSNAHTSTHAQQEVPTETRGVNQQVAPGPFSGTYDLPVPGETGQYQVCAYLDDASKAPQESGQAVAGASIAFTALPPDTGVQLTTVMFPRLDLLNRTALQINVGCRGTGCSAVAGKVSVTLSAASRRKLGVASAKILSGPLKPCGEGNTCAAMSFSKAVRKKIRKADERSERRGFSTLKITATLSITVTAPLARTVSAPLTFATNSGRRTYFFCASDNPARPCTDRDWLTGDDAGGAPSGRGGRGRR